MYATPVLAATLAVVFLAFGTAKLMAVPSMRTRAAHVGFSVGAYRWIGGLEVAGAAGLLLGALPLVRASAAVGLLLLLAGAVVTHVRHKDGIRGAAPALVLSSLLVVLLTLEVLGMR